MRQLQRLAAAGLEVRLAPSGALHVHGNPTIRLWEWLRDSRGILAAELRVSSLNEHNLKVLIQKLVERVASYDSTLAHQLESDLLQQLITYPWMAREAVGLLWVALAEGRVPELQILDPQSFPCDVCSWMTDLRELRVCSNSKHCPRRTCKQCRLISHPEKHCRGCSPAYRISKWSNCRITAKHRAFTSGEFTLLKLEGETPQ